jgi:2,4-dichlorophenol 6-monooxygenase
MDCYYDWARFREIGEDGVLLVRPDHFVAWRYHTSSDDATGLLRTALRQILCLKTKTPSNGLS